MRNENKVYDLKTLLNGLTKEELNQISPVQDVLASILGVSVRQLRDYIHDGCSTNLLDAIQWYCNYLKEKNSKSKSGSAKERKDNLQADIYEEKLKKLQEQTIDKSKHYEILESRARELKIYLTESLQRNVFLFANLSADELKLEFDQFVSDFIVHYTRINNPDDNDV